MSEGSNSPDRTQSDVNYPFKSLARKAYWASEDEEKQLRQYLPLLYSEVNRVAAALPQNYDLSDLVSAGLVGLVQAWRRFDPTSGTPFLAYALRRIRGAILDELRRSDWMSRSTRAKAKIISEAIRQFEQIHGRPASPDEIAAELGLSNEDYSKLLDEVRPISFVQIDATPEDSDLDSLHDVIPDSNAESIQEILQKRELIELISKRIRQMPLNTQKILAMYYYEGMKLAEIAKVFGVTESRICQIHTHAILSLRTYIQALLKL
ncbi:MAG: FliA/WhiG family RNA polymerase sigma factor [Chthoniobacterales bacterium]|nr:FliA/WhiG family RNA polymerase sigma factor [Chthoniobacterales bacterium]